MLITQKIVLSLLMAVFLAGCGGSSGSGSETPSNSNTDTNYQDSTDLETTPDLEANPEPETNPEPEIPAPVLPSLSFSVDEDSLLQGSIAIIDESNTALAYKVTEDVSYGELTLNNSGSFSYRPNLNYWGTDQFKAKVQRDGLESDEVEFTISVNGVNDAPVLSEITTSTRLDQPISIPLKATDVDGDTLTFSIVSQPNKGIAKITGNSMEYTPNAGALEEDIFEIEVSDGELTKTAQVTIDNGLAFAGQVTGLLNDTENTEVLLISDKVLETKNPDENGIFKFYSLSDGDYAVKVRKSGYKSTKAYAFSLPANNNESARNTATVKSFQVANQQASSATEVETINFPLEEINSDTFTFHWEEDQSTAGYDYSSYVNSPEKIEFLDEQLEIVDDSSANLLQHDYNIALVNIGAVNWTQEHAYRLVQTMKSIPQETRDSNKKQYLLPSKWQLTDEFVQDDIQITQQGEYKTVLVSSAAFVNATPRMAEVDGKRGVFYSQRLHQALVRFVTEEGNNERAYEKILNERYGISTKIPSYSTLTASSTNESTGRFQKFHAEEIIQIINMFEEMPVGMHKLPELKYLVRRLDGTPHPLYSSAPAVAWPESGYIEFMESAFNTSNVGHMHRLIIHEKSHFLWHNQFDDQLKNDWIALGGWYQDASTQSGWATTKQTEFVSAYAHSKNPNEDMAESISYFIINPDELKSRAINKYEFIRDRIMQGNIYISQIREDLTFEVYNLYPDYVFPGKIKRLDIEVLGAANEDKVVSIEIELHALDAELAGAKNAYMRIFSEIGTFKELYLYPEGTTGTTLRGSFTLNKRAKAGYWRTSQIVLTDAVGNKRMEGANDFGWKLYINNALEDTTPPEYVPGSALLTKSTSEREGQEVQIIHANWQVDEAVLMANKSPCYASMNDENLNTYRVEEYGVFDEVNQRCSVDFIMPHYMPSSTYSMQYIKMQDQALNKRGVYFTRPDMGLREESINLDELPQEIELITNDQDIVQPELDLNDIQITATPTNIEAPNGETIVTITFKVRDNISGYRIASLQLRDPQGIEHHYWAYNEGSWSLFPTRELNKWHTYTRNVVLPAGSAPGIWGMSEMTIYDRAGNFKGYDFTEVVHFDVE